jgi:hypothetical protein
MDILSDIYVPPKLIDNLKNDKKYILIILKTLKLYFSYVAPFDNDEFGVLKDILFNHNESPGYRTTNLVLNSDFFSVKKIVNYSYFIELLKKIKMYNINNDDGINFNEILLNCYELINYSTFIIIENISRLFNFRSVKYKKLKSKEIKSIKKLISNIIDYTNNCFDKIINDFNKYIKNEDNIFMGSEENFNDFVKYKKKLDFNLFYDFFYNLGECIKFIRSESEFDINLPYNMENDKKHVVAILNLINNMNKSPKFKNLPDSFKINFHEILQKLNNLTLFKSDFFYMLNDFHFNYNYSSFILISTFYFYLYNFNFKNFLLFYEDTYKTNIKYSPSNININKEFVTLSLFENIIEKMYLIIKNNLIFLETFKNDYRNCCLQLLFTLDYQSYYLLYTTKFNITKYITRRQRIDFLKRNKKKIEKINIQKINIILNIFLDNIIINTIYDYDFNFFTNIYFMVTSKLNFHTLTTKSFKFIKPINSNWKDQLIWLSIKNLDSNISFIFYPVFKKVNHYKLEYKVNKYFLLNYLIDELINEKLYDQCFFLFNFIENSESYLVNFNIKDLSEFGLSTKNLILDGLFFTLNKFIKVDTFFTIKKIELFIEYSIENNFNFSKKIIYDMIFNFVNNIMLNKDSQKDNFKIQLIQIFMIHKDVACRDEKKGVNCLNKNLGLFYKSIIITYNRMYLLLIRFLLAYHDYLDDEKKIFFNKIFLHFENFTLGLSDDFIASNDLFEKESSREIVKDFNRIIGKEFNIVKNDYNKKRLDYFLTCCNKYEIISFIKYLINFKEISNDKLFYYIKKIINKKKFSDQINLIFNNNILNDLLTKFNNKKIIIDNISIDKFKLLMKNEYTNEILIILKNNGKNILKYLNNKFDIIKKKKKKKIYNTIIILFGYTLQILLSFYFLMKKNKVGIITSLSILGLSIIIGIYLYINRKNRIIKKEIIITCILLQYDKKSDLIKNKNNYINKFYPDTDINILSDNILIKYPELEFYRKSWHEMSNVGSYYNVKTKDNLKEKMFYLNNYFYEFSNFINFIIFVPFDENHLKALYTINIYASHFIEEKLNFFDVIYFLGDKKCKDKKCNEKLVNTLINIDFKNSLKFSNGYGYSIIKKYNKDYNNFRFLRAIKLDSIIVRDFKRFNFIYQNKLENKDFCFVINAIEKFSIYTNNFIKDDEIILSGIIKSGKIKTGKDIMILGNNVIVKTKVLKIIKYYDKKVAHKVSKYASFPEIIGIVVKNNDKIFPGSTIINLKYDSNYLSYTNKLNCNILFDIDIGIEFIKNLVDRLYRVFYDKTPIYLYYNEKYLKVKNLKFKSYDNKDNKKIYSSNNKFLYRIELTLNENAVFRKGSRLSILQSLFINKNLNKIMEDILEKNKKYDPKCNLNYPDFLECRSIINYSHSEKNFLKSKLLDISKLFTIPFLSYHVVKSDLSIKFIRKKFIGIGFIESFGKENNYDNFKSYLNNDETNIFPINKNITRFNFFNKNPIHKFTKKSLTFQSGRYDFVKVFQSRNVMLNRITPTTDVIGEFFTLLKSSWLEAKVRLAIKDFWESRDSKGKLSIWPSKLYAPTQFMDVSNSKDYENDLTWFSGIVGDQGGVYMGGLIQIYRFIGAKQANSCNIIPMGVEMGLSFFKKNNLICDKIEMDKFVLKDIKKTYSDFNENKFKEIFNHKFKNKIKFFNGDIYEGDIKDNNINGIGKYIWSDGEVYHGEFKDGLPDGIGYRIYNNNDFWLGSWRNGYRYGFGYIMNTEKIFSASLNIIDNINDKWYYENVVRDFENEEKSDDRRIDHRISLKKVWFKHYYTTL